MPSAFIVQTLMSTLLCRFHCSCRTGEQGNRVKYSVLVPGGSRCSCCQDQFSQGAEVLPTASAVPRVARQPGPALGRCPESPLQVSWTTEQWLTLSVGKRALRLLELLLKCFQQHCGKWGFCGQGSSSRSWLFPHSAHKRSPAITRHKESRFILPPPRVEQTPRLFLFFSLLRRKSSGLL